MTALPPGPREPRALQTLEWIARPTAFLRRCAARHGEPFTLRTHWTDAPMVLVSHPDDVRRVFTARELRGPGAGSILEPFAGPSSILVVDGEEHLRARRLMLGPFHGERMRAVRPLVTELARRELASWPRDRPVRTHERMQALTLEVMLHVVFGRPDDRLRDAISDALALTRSAPRLAAIALGARSGFARAVERVDRLLQERIAGDADPDSMLAQLREAGVGDRELRDHLVTLLAAGHETTATALAWAFERLGRHPGVADRLRDGDPAYREAVAREVLRIRPVLSVAPRTVAEPFDVAGTTLPPGVQVAPCIYLTHRREDVWGDPHAFRPERFLERKPSTYEWIPFGGGTRRCAGAPFALMEMEAVLEEAAKLGRLESDPERVRRRAVTLGPARGGRVAVR